MRWTTDTIKVSMTCTFFLVTGWLPGCHFVINPWQDEAALEPPVTTLSAEYARAIDAEQSLRQRNFPADTVEATEGAVTHGALFFEEPVEDVGSEDERFAWTAEDLLHSVLGPMRFLANGALAPISVFVTPPWTVMSSDGEPSRRIVWLSHDAGRWEPSPDH